MNQEIEGLPAVAQSIEVRRILSALERQGYVRVQVRGGAMSSDAFGWAEIEATTRAGATQCYRYTVPPADAAAFEEIWGYPPQC